MLERLAHMKLTHAAVAFEHPAQGKNHCSECAHFLPSVSRCQIVKSPIEPSDWCNRFEYK